MFLNNTGGIEVYSPAGVHYVTFNLPGSTYLTGMPTIHYGQPCSGDFDGDGYLDLAITAWSTYDIVVNNTIVGREAKSYLMVNLSSAGLVNNPSNWVISNLDDCPFSSPYVVAKDINGDGKDELFVAGINSISIQQTDYATRIFKCFVNGVCFRYLKYNIKVSSAQFSFFENSLVQLRLYHVTNHFYKTFSSIGYTHYFNSDHLKIIEYCPPMVFFQMLLLISHF